MKLKNIIYSVRFRIISVIGKITDKIQLVRSKSIDISSVRTVCLALGPYRNLTTLTASVLFLHPNCEVLNHAGSRIFGNKEIDFLNNGRFDLLDRFIQFALSISQKGQRGSWGGSIMKSHAFDSKYNIKKIYNKNKDSITNNEIQSLFWKESLRTSNVIKDRNIDFSELLADERLRFLVPIRNPLDCAFSNYSCKFTSKFKGLNDESSFHDVIVAVLDELYWFESLRNKYPNRFFYFFENDINRTILEDLSKFLKLDVNDEWFDNALTVMSINQGYEQDEESVKVYSDYLHQREEQFPVFTRRLKSFIPEN